MSSTEHSDIIVIGAGIVGLATAHQILMRRPDLRVTVLEKEAAVAQHQTGRNSGVIHSGVYYKPGSLKAKNCLRGIDMLQRFAEENGIPYETCGKVIVAVTDDERPGLHKLFERGQQNGVPCELVDKARLNELEPHVAGVEAIHVKSTGIIDYALVCRKLAEVVQAAGSRVVCNAGVERIDIADRGVTIETPAGEFHANHLINCAGLQSDRIAALTGVRPSVRIVPFRGEYFDLTDDATHLCKNLIYPVPDPAFPFLGVHFTRMITGGVECGPNAVLAFAREGYTNTTINLRDLAQTLGYPAFWKIATKYWKTGLGEMHRSFSKAAFVRALQRLMPEIRAEHLRSAPAGVRAQALAADGQLLDDFAIDETDRVINVVNAPSPAATASLSIGDTVAEKLLTRYDAPKPAPSHEVAAAGA
jgi:L-2-hydroxyglutarate oxidase